MCIEAPPRPTIGRMALDDGEVFSLGIGDAFDGARDERDAFDDDALTFIRIQKGHHRVRKLDGSRRQRGR